MADLSPAAQAVLDAVRVVPVLLNDHQERVGLAAALRALADHQRPSWDGSGLACHWMPTPHTRRELRNIAAELEGTE